MLNIISFKKLYFRLSIVTIAFLLSTTLAVSQITTSAVDFNHKRGFYSESIQLELSCKTIAKHIIYTLDGSKPSITNGQIYTEPIPISSNTMVRAFAHTENLADSKIKTHSYIFTEQVIRQKNMMLEDYGYDYSSNETGKVFWTEEMDPEIVDAVEYKDEIIKGLTDIPSLSVVMPKADLWGNNGIHWGDNLEKGGDNFERECSIEMIYPKDYKGDILNNWQENCGIKIQGGGGRWDKGTYDHKQSFSIVFKKIYGAGKLKNEIFADAPHGKNTTAGKYDKIVLRSGHNKSWGADWDREKSVYTRDQLGRDLQILMSGFGSHGTFVHLYLNGKYWGLYNPCERPDNNFLANYFGGESEDYFYAKGKDWQSSDSREGEPGQSKTRFYAANSKNYSNMHFDEMQQWLMVDKSIASFLVYGYANPGDGPQYYYGNNNNPPGPLVWIPWDVEDSFDGGSRRTGDPSIENMLDDKKSGDNGFEAFWTNIDFRMRFNDLVYMHFFNNGVMTDENVTLAFENLNNYIYRPIICESARWGDERSTNPMERDNEWDSARQAVINDLKGRANKFIFKLRSAKYFSTLLSPTYATEGNQLTINRAGDKGVVYYTFDNSDPREWNLTASISDNAIMIDGLSKTLEINRATTVRARTKNNDEWSPLHKALILPDGTVIHESNKPDSIVIPEIIIKEPDDTTLFLPIIEEKLVLFPNPVSNKLFLSKEKEYAIYSTMGILISEGTGKEIPMANFPEGLYIIKIENKLHKIMKRD